MWKSLLKCFEDGIAGGNGIYRAIVPAKVKGKHQRRVAP
jgi:hypothetical protein